MKNTIKVFGIIALAAVIGFSMTACGEEDDSPKPQKSQSVIDEVTAIAYGNGKFVAVGYSINYSTETYTKTYTNKIATSTDGVTWTAVTQSVFGDDAYINGIVYGNGKFVAYNYSKGNDNTKIATSTDGVTWTSADVNNIFNINEIQIVFGNGKFVAVGYSYSINYSTYTSTQKIATSTDGVIWTTADVSSIFSSYYINSINSISYCNGKFFAVGSYSNTPKILTSTDGITWTAVTQSVFGDDDYIHGIVYGNGKFFAVGRGRKMATSTDGVTWTASGFISCEGIDEIVYGNGKFVAVGTSYDRSPETFTAKMATSTDGITWTEVDIGNLFNCVITDKGTTYSGSYISAIVYGGGKFVAGGGDGVIATSTDGIKWTKSVINHK